MQYIKRFINSHNTATWIILTIAVSLEAWWLYVDKEAAARLGFALYAGISFLSLLLTIKTRLSDKQRKAIKYLLSNKRVGHTTK